MAPEDLLEADHINPDYHGEVYYVKYNAQQKWYYLHNQTPDEVTFFVSFDSGVGNEARCEFYHYCFSYTFLCTNVGA